MYDHWPIGFWPPLYCIRLQPWCDTNVVQPINYPARHTLRWIEARTITADSTTRVPRTATGTEAGPSDGVQEVVG